MTEPRRSARLSPGVFKPSAHSRIYPDLSREPSHYQGSLHYSSDFEKSAERASSDEDEEGCSSQDSSFTYEGDSSRSFIQKEEKQSEEQNQKIVVIFVAILVILLSIIGGGMLTDNSSSGIYEEYSKKVQTFTKTKNLNVDNLVMMKVIGRKAFSDTSESPQAIVISGNGARSFAQEFSQMLQEAQKPGARMGSTKALEITEEMDRAEIHDDLLKALESQVKQNFKSRAVVVNDIDLLKWDAVLAIHAFADHETYPIPKSLLIFTIRESYENLSDGYGCDEKVANHLSSKWKTKGANDDNISPIISRISYYICI